MKTREVLSKITAGLRDRGLKYPFQAVVNELRYPRLSVTRHLRKIIIRTGDTFRATPRNDTAWSEDSLLFVYDLRVSPVTFDFASYLAAAEIERRLRGLAAINVVFITGTDIKIRQEQPDYEAVLDRDARLFRFHNVILPMLRILPSIRGYAQCGNLKMAEALLAASPDRHLYPADYRLFLPRQPSKRDLFDHARAGREIWPMYSATAKARTYVREFLQQKAANRLPVVITLRNYDYMPVRNSRNEDWIAFADRLDRDKYVPIFVHDAETIMRPRLPGFADHISCDAASWNLEIRVALFEQAWLNLATMHGPMELCWYLSDARYVVFLNVGSVPQTEPARFEENGQTVGEDFDFCQPYQHIAWCEDSLVNIHTEFERMKKIIGPTPDGPVHQIKTPNV